MPEFKLRCSVTVPAYAEITVDATTEEEAKKQAMTRWLNGEIEFSPHWRESDHFDARKAGS
jgi:hypothetical protein